MDVEKKDNTQAQKPADKDQHQQQKGKDNKKKKVAEEEMVRNIGFPMAIGARLIL